MATVALVAHRDRALAGELAHRATDWLESRGHSVRMPKSDAAGVGLDRLGWPSSELGADLDLAVSLGGDGTMLRTVDLVGFAGVPVLGVNVGHLGYLTEVEPSGLVDALAGFLAGDAKLESRMSLQVDVHRGPGSDHPSPSSRLALNEAVLEKTVAGHTVRLAMIINGEEFLTCAADGLIVATPTGSTAYNLSARGPIVSPRLRAIVVTPVSPHMLFDRSLVLGLDEWVRLEVLDGPMAALTVDGTDLGHVGPGAAVVCRVGTHDASFVTFDHRDFHQILKAKFRLADG